MIYWPDSGVIEGVDSCLGVFDSSWPAHNGRRVPIRQFMEFGITTSSVTSRNLYTKQFCHFWFSIIVLFYKKNIFLIEHLFFAYRAVLSPSHLYNLFHVPSEVTMIFGLTLATKYLLSLSIIWQELGLSLIFWR